MGTESGRGVFMSLILAAATLRRDARRAAGGGRP